METPQPYTTACSSVHPPNKVVFKIKCNFLYFSLCPLSLILSGRFCLHLFYFPHQAFIHVDKMPLTLLSSRLNVSSSLSICSYDRCSSPLIIFVLLCWTHSSMSLFLLYWRAQVGTQHSRCVSFAEGKIKSQPASKAYPMQLRRSMYCKGMLLVLDQSSLVSISTQSPFLQACFQAGQSPECIGA